MKEEGKINHGELEKPTGEHGILTSIRDESDEACIHIIRSHMMRRRMRMLRRYINSSTFNSHESFQAIR
jgi:hypothetical protein